MRSTWSSIESLLSNTWKLAVTWFALVSAARQENDSRNNTGLFLAYTDLYFSQNRLHEQVESYHEEPPTSLVHLCQKSAKQTQEWLTPLDRPPLDRSLFVRDGTFAFDTTEGDWDPNTRIEQELQKLKKKIGSMKANKILERFDQLLKTNPEFEEFTINEKTEELALHAMSFLGNLSDVLNAIVPALELKHGTHVEFAGTSGLLTACLMAQENKIYRLELVTAINRQSGKHLIVVANRNKASALHVPSTWGHHHKIIDAWFNDNQRNGVYSSAKMSKLLTELKWDYWEARDFTPISDFTGAPKSFLEFYNWALGTILEPFKKSAPLTMNRLTKFCDPAVFAYRPEERNTDQESEDSDQSRQMVM